MDFLVTESVIQALRITLKKIANSMRNSHFNELLNLTELNDFVPQGLTQFWLTDISTNDSWILSKPALHLSLKAAEAKLYCFETVLQFVKSCFWHALPFPLYPTLHLQEYPSILSIQDALSSQSKLASVHSLTRYWVPKIKIKPRVS